jgi:hypothetical protein
MNQDDLAGEEVRIGVTGHRTFEVGDSAVRADRLLDGIIGSHRPVVLSSLAEGADRMVTELVLARPSSRLDVILPLEADDYERDFATVESVAAFRGLLARADSIVTVDLPEGATREEAYERAGHEVVARCDVLIAVWDGATSRGRGGTAEIVDHARQIGRRVELVSVGRDSVR